MNIQSIPQSDPDGAALTRAIARQRDHLLNLDLHVHLRRNIVDGAVAELREAVRQRDAAAVHLDHLIAWRDGLAA